MTSKLKNRRASPKLSKQKKSPPRARGRPRSAKPTGRVSGNRKVTGYEAGRIKRARAQLKGLSAGLMPWEQPGLSCVQAVKVFLEALPITKGILQGQTMRLLPHQHEFIEMIYGSDPQPKLGISSLPRGNGKTALVANLALCHLLGPEAETRGAVYSAATDRAQAALTFAEIEATICAVPQFSVRCAISGYHKRITVLDGHGEGSVYEALSADAPRAFGLAPSLWLYDELAQAKDRKLLDALMTATGKRRNSLGLIISTQAQTDDHPLSILIDGAIAGRAPGTACQLKAAPMDADPFALETIQDCNPASGIYLNESDLVAAADMARRSYAFEPAYRNLRLNQRIRTDVDARLVDSATWNRGAVPVIERNLVGKNCTCGLDLAAKHDLTALILAFPSPNGSFDVLCRFWTPQGQLAGRRPGERELFEQWISAGFLISVPGEIIDPEWVVRELAILAERFRFQEIRYDKYRIAELKLAMAKAGVNLPLVEHQQGFVSMGPALSLLADKLRAGQVRHGGNPILTHCIGNAVVVGDASDNLKFHKGKSHSTSKLRIDGAVALAMAVSPMPAEEPRTFQLMFI